MEYGGIESPLVSGVKKIKWGNKISVTGSESESMAHENPEADRILQIVQTARRYRWRLLVSKTNSDRLPMPT
jgi:hypothetical protein